MGCIVSYPITVSNKHGSNLFCFKETYLRFYMKWPENKVDDIHLDCHGHYRYQVIEHFKWK